MSLLASSASTSAWEIEQCAGNVDKWTGRPVRHTSPHWILDLVQPLPWNDGDHAHLGGSTWTDTWSALTALAPHRDHAQAQENPA